MTAVNCCMLQALLLLFFLPHFGKTQSSAIFTEMPTSWNATLGDGNVTFQCRAQNADAVTWRLNGSFLSQVDPVIVKGIVQNIMLTEIGFLYTLRIPATAEYNNTVVECAALISGVNHFLSDRVVLRVQGVLGAVSYLRIYPQQTSILLTWTPPFSLDISGVDPDLWYCMEVFNVTAGRTLFTTNCSVYEPEFEFTAPNPSPCDQFEFRVIPVNGAGNGNVTTINGTLFEAPGPVDVKIQVEVLSDIEMKVGITFSQPQDICSSQIFVTQSTTELSQVFTLPHERTGTSINVTNDTLPFNYRYNITIELGNAAGRINVTGDLSLFDIQTATVNSNSPGTVNVSCMFAKNSRALGCLVILHPQNVSQSEMLAYAARDNSSAPTANISIPGVPKGSHTVQVLDGEQNGLLSTRAAAVQNVTVEEGGPEPAKMDLPVSANIQRTHNQICIQCPENGEIKGCVMISHPTWNLESVESHIIQKSRRRCFHQPTGEYTVAVFGQSAGGVLQKVPLNVSVVSISEPTTLTSLSTTTTAEQNLSLCAADCIAGIVLAAAVATMSVVVVVGTALIFWKKKCGRRTYKINRHEGIQPEESNWEDTNHHEQTTEDRYIKFQTTDRTMTSPPPMYANLSHTETQHAMPASDITVEHGESDHTQGTDQDDRVHHYSAIVQQTVEMQPENATFVPSEQPAPPLLLPDTRAGHYSSLNLDTLFTELHPIVTAKWQELGEALGIDEDLLDEIFTNNATDDECLRDALKQWLKIRPASEDLSDALQKIGESQLAELLHPTSFCALDHEDENSRVSVEDTIQTG